MSLQDQWYKPITDNDLHGFRCVKHKLSKEKCIAGKYGEIWENSDNTLKCLVISSKLVTKLAKALGTEVPNVDKSSETVFTFNKNQLLTITKLLKCPTEAGRQVTILNKRY